MISLEEAQARIIALATLLPGETIVIDDALGRYTAEPLLAKRTQPACDLSAMDGYAVAGERPGPWRVIGESAAGASFGQAIGHGEAARIFTGAALPSGTDSIIIQENARREGDMLVADAPPVGRHVRNAGSEFSVGDVLIEAGEPLTAPRLALAAVGGHGEVAMRRRPRVALLATGNELVPPGQPVTDDQLPETNSLMVAAMLEPLRCEVQRLGIVRDDIDAIVTAIRAADADVLITNGGASVGDHDLVKPALEACGAEMEFLKVAMRPGKPVMAGRIGEMVVLGLPGNPVSAFATTLLFALPLVRAMLGSTRPLPMFEMAHLACDLPPNGPRVDHVRAKFEPDGVSMIGANDSAALRALADASCLIRQLPNAIAAKAGDEVEVIRLA